MAADSPSSGPETQDSLFELWNSNSTPFEERGELLKRIEAAGLLPRITGAMDEWERDAGLYPDTEDPRFIEKLMAKREFAEHKYESIAQQAEEGVDPCNQEFELTPVQRFVGRFLSPQCPYTSALLFHGVGVGKTCAAITIAENYLRAFPRKSVFIVAPRNIQPGFRNTIFSDTTETLEIPAEEGKPNEAKGCTGNLYLKRTGTEFEKDRGKISRAVKDAVASRYSFMGYIQFSNYIKDLLKHIPRSLDEETYKQQKARVLRREFSGRLLIIDEAHNLRDNPAETADDSRDNPGGDAEATESQAGKRLTPELEAVLDSADGMKLVLLTGTPMYNSYREIIFLLNLLLRNDKKVELSEADIFTREGAFRPAAEGRRSGEQILGGVAAAYVSFMRGENPLAFPIRLPPQGVPALAEWPRMTLDAKEIAEEARARMLRLPFVPLSYEGDSLEEYQRLSQEIIETGGIGINSIDEMVQAGNWLFPAGDRRQARDIGFDTCFETTAGSLPFKVRGDDASWLLTANLGQTSTKAKFILERAAGARGPVFVYSRFIKSGALPLALALEANGYLPWNRRPMLANGAVDGLGGQCALCSKRANGHTAADHKFTQAHYVLITGRSSISPKNSEDIQAARAVTNKRGSQIKVVIGSQVASEGVDFRFIRDIYVFDSWFHLNKMEQVLGRGVRFCSHSLLPQEERNCTIHLLVQTIEAADTETADLYMYREAMTKAIQVGRVTRVLKQYALDCNLNKDAVQITGLATQRHIDSQGVVREEVNVNDMPFTNVCDWIETCEYKCAKVINEADMGTDLSTYTDYAVRWRESKLRGAIRALFSTREQPVFQLEEILDMMSAVPQRAVQGLLAEIVGNQAFRVRMGKKEGYIVYRNGYYMFQPEYLTDTRVPLALRVADVPVKRDSFEPTKIHVEAAPAASFDALAEFWKAIQQWATEIAAGAAIKENIPPYCCGAIDAAFSGDERTRERERLIMINWFYDHILSTEGYSSEQKTQYLSVLSDVLLDFVWDESFKMEEQRKLAAAGGDTTMKAAREQLLKRGEQTAFRWVDPMSGIVRYMCGDKECFPAVVQGFERDDPMRGLKADQTTTGRSYGFIVPKAKEGRLVFKTNDSAAAPGKPPEKGKECTIVSTISYHITDLKALGEIFVAEGLPKFILTEDVLDEKARRVKERADAKAAGRAAPERPKVEVKVCGSREPNAKGTRSFENSTRACALKDIMLRWLDNMNQRRGAGRLRYFYRPIAALKSGHRGAVAKA